MSEINRGSRWWKFDFHTHTPHSIDTPWAELVGTSGELTPVAWLQKFMEAGIDFAEDDISVAPSSELLRRLDPILKQTTSLARSFIYGNLVREGFSLGL